MRAQDLTRHLETFAVKIRLPQKGYTVMMDTMVQARNAEMARRLIRQLYGSKTALVGAPRLVKTR